jgi:SAM-dependent methyltransferase
VPTVPFDYDSDPARVRSCDPSWQVGGDVHEPVAARIVAEDLRPVLDVGGGPGRLLERLPAGWPAWIIDCSPTQLADAPGGRVLADAAQLPVASSRVGVVAMLWMLYHCAEPHVAIAEARRVLHSGGLFLAWTASRRNDPELTDGYPPTPFDAEEAPALVAGVFGDVEVRTWDAPMTRLPDRTAVEQYCRGHSLPRSAADRVDPPVWLTKRGCLVSARR